MNFGIAGPFLKYLSHSVLGLIFNKPVVMKEQLIQVNDSRKQATCITWCMCHVTNMLSCRQSSAAFVLDVEVRSDVDVYNDHRYRLGVGEGPIEHIAEKALPLECNLVMLNGGALD